MAWIKTFGIGVILFSMIFTAYFALFQTMDSGYDYASGFNYTEDVYTNLNHSTNMELETSYNSSNTQKDNFNNASISSTTAYDNLISNGYNAITTVWNYPVQAYHLITTTLGGLLGIDDENYKWVSQGILAIITLLVLFAILTVIFRSNL